MGDVLDLAVIWGALFEVHLPKLRAAAVVGDKELRPFVLRVVCALDIHLLVNGDIVRLAFDNDQCRFPVAAILYGAPNNEIRPGVFSATLSGGRHL